MATFPPAVAAAPPFALLTVRAGLGPAYPAATGCRSGPEDDPNEDVLEGFDQELLEALGEAVKEIMGGGWGGGVAGWLGAGVSVVCVRVC
jgi:hypothetical protein